MGNLPEERVTPGRAFQHTGVDYCGPFMVKARPGRSKITYKVYVAVFICMKSRAVHIKLVSGQSSEDFIAAYYRLTSRRGRVDELHSNATTFIGADRGMQAIIKSWQKAACSTELADAGTR